MIDADLSKYFDTIPHANVLPTFAFHQVAHVKDHDVLEAGAYTLNKAMGDFCGPDERLKAIGYLPLSLGPQRAGEIMDQGLKDGCFSFMVDTNEPADDKLSFTHPDFDAAWATSQLWMPSITEICSQC